MLRPVATNHAVRRVLTVSRICPEVLPALPQPKTDARKRSRGRPAAVTNYALPHAFPGTLPVTLPGSNWGASHSYDTTSQRRRNLGKLLRLWLTCPLCPTGRIGKIIYRGDRARCECKSCGLRFSVSLQAVADALERFAARDEQKAFQRECGVLRIRYLAHFRPGQTEQERMLTVLAVSDRTSAGVEQPKPIRRPGRRFRGSDRDAWSWE